jgi:hypothetical protein
MVQAFKSKRAEERAAVLRLELDYELASLHDAMEAGDEEKSARCKERLKDMRSEMLQLEM